MLNKRPLWLGAAAVAGVSAAIGIGYYLGHHNLSAAYADVPQSPEMVASASGAPSVPGLCVLSQNAVYANAKVGQAATARYRELNAQLRGQLAPEQQGITDDAKKLQAAQKSMPAPEFQAKAQELAKREQEFRATDALDGRELEATRQKALRQIAVMANPVISDAYKEHHCGVLFSRDMMLAGNPGMDLTPVVVAGLDAKVTTISFELEKLPANVAAAPAQQPVQ